MGIEFSQRVTFDGPGRLFVDKQDNSARIWVELMVRAVGPDNKKQRLEMQWSLPDDCSIVVTKQRVPRKLDRGFPPDVVGQAGLLESKSTWVQATLLAEHRWSFSAPSRATAPAARLAFMIEQPVSDAVWLPTGVSATNTDGDLSARWAIYCRPPAGHTPAFVTPEESDTPLHPSFETGTRRARRFAWGGPFARLGSSKEQPMFRAVTTTVPNTFDRSLAWHTQS